MKTFSFVSIPKQDNFQTTSIVPDGDEKAI